MKTRSRRPSLTLTLTLALLGSSLLAGCQDDFPADPPRDFDSFGVEAYRMLHDELSWSGTVAEGRARASTLEARRGDVVWALDTLVASPVSERILPLLEELLPLYDPRPDGAAGALPQMTRDVAEIIDLLITDQPLLDALAPLLAAPSANPSAPSRLIGALIRHPIALADPLIDLTLDLEPQLTELLRWLHRELRDLDEAEPLAADQRSLLQRLLDVTIEVTAEPIGPPVLSARFDGRGAPVVRTRADGSLPAPFVDADGDGQPDVDELARPVDASGAVIEMETFQGRPGAGEDRDKLGRAIVDGELVFDYFDLRQSALAYLLRDGRKLLADGVQYDLFTAFEAVLGGRVSRDDEDGQYTGYYVEQAPLLDLLYALTELGRYPRLVPLVRALEQASVQQEPLLRQLIVDVAKARQIFETAPSLTPGNALFEDLHPVLAAMASHGELRALIAASTEPQTQGLFDGLATMMRYSGLALPSDMSTLETPAQVDALSFTDPTPWDRADATDAERSWLQKAAYLMWDTREAEVLLRLFDRVVVHEVQITADMSKLYVDAIAHAATIELGNALLDTLAVDLIDELDDLTPTAEQLNLFMNHDQHDTGNPVCNQGELVKDHYGPALLALQTSGNLDAMRPWVRKIVALGREEDFVDLFAVLGEHFSEQAFEHAGFVSYGTGVRRLEPYLVAVIEDTELPAHFLRFSAWADGASFTVDGQTYNVADELDAFLTWVLDPNAHVPQRDGTAGVPSKRGGMIANPSRLQLLTHALDRIDEAVSASPTAKTAWDHVDLVGVFLDLDDSGALANPHALDLTVALLPIVADAVAQAVAEPDWLDSLDSLVGDAEDVLGSRGFVGLSDAMARIRDTPRHRAFVDQLIAALLAELPAREDADLFGATLQALSSLVQLRPTVDVTARALGWLGEVADPAKRYLFRALESLRALRAKDPEGIFTALGVNLFAEPEIGRIPARLLGEAFAGALRPQPDASVWHALSSPDLAAILTDLRDWLRDEDKGAERLYEVIRSR